MLLTPFIFSKEWEKERAGRRGGRKRGARDQSGQAGLLDGQTQQATPGRWNTGLRNDEMLRRRTSERDTCHRQIAKLLCDFFLQTKTQLRRRDGRVSVRRRYVGQRYVTPPAGVLQSWTTKTFVWVEPFDLGVCVARSAANLRRSRKSAAGIFTTLSSQAG